MREYDLKKALSTGSYTRNSIKPQLLVAEDGEYRQGDILDANATMEAVNSTASNIDDKINDILGVDNGAVQELVEILSDSDTTTGILNELAKKANISDLETVAGDIPQVPTNVSAFTNDAGYLTQHQDISGKANSSDLSTVATSGSYNDLSNKPHIPEDPVQSDWTEDDTTDQAYIKNKPNLATVATTGDYTDLSNKPDLNDFVIKPTSLSNTNNHPYVDLGLPSGTLWATMNIGADSETDYGNYYQYGKGSAQYLETVDQSDYSQYGILPLSVDTAAQVWGGSWYTPTISLYVELIDNTTYVFTTINGVPGGKFTAPNGNYVFFPASGRYEDNLLLGLGLHAGYSTSTGISTTSVAIMFIDSETPSYATAILSHTDRRIGMPVRAVLNSTSKVATTGNYSDLINKPTIPAEQIQSDWNQSDTTAKDYIKNKPTIPTKVSDLTNNLDLLQRPHSSNGHEYVEIGGIKWATMNVGASSETDKGLYFAWGETEGYRIYADDSQNTRDFSESEYKYAELDGSDYVYTKYNSTDGKSSLDLEDDAARANWGGNWRIPTRAEFSTLFINCVATIVRDSNDSPIGFLFTDKTDSTKSIYFPGCRGRKDGLPNDKNYYNALPIWTNQRYDLSDYSYDDIVWIVGASYVTTNGVDTPQPSAAETALRYSGRPVRAILDEPTPSNTASKVAVTGDYNDLVNKPIIRSESLTLNLSDQTSTITGANNSGRVEIVIYDNTSQNDYTVSISTSYKTVDGNQIILSVPAGCYGEVCYTNIGGTIFAKGIKQLANS